MTFGAGVDSGGFEGSSTEVARRQADGSWRYVIDDPGSRIGSPVANVAAPVARIPFEQLVYEQDGPVARIRLSRPERRNALSIQLSEELMEALERVRVSQTLKVLVIEGAGETFCSGDDVTEMGAWGNAKRHRPTRPRLSTHGRHASRPRQGHDRSSRRVRRRRWPRDHHGLRLRGRNASRKVGDAGGRYRHHSWLGRDHPDGAPDRTAPD